jgi:hypothetical protein
MATLGPNDLKQYALPTYWDATELEKIRLADGTTYAGFINDVSQGLALQNAALLADPLLGTMMAATTEAAVEYGVGVSNGFEEATEYGLPDAKRAATTGHMLGLKEYDRAFGWTWMFLNKARRMQLDEDIASAMADLKNLWAQKILTRFFKSTYDSVGSGRSMPFADGGTADSSWVPKPNPDRADAFAYTHTHLLRLDGITQANLETAVKHLWEHGHDGPYELLVAQADIGSWRNTTNVTGYVSRPDPLIRYGVQTDLANVMGEGIDGVIETAYGACRLRPNGRIPTNYWGLYKSYGVRDQRNPLWIRYNPKFGVGAVLLAGDHIRQYPLENAILWMEFGANVGRDRTNGVLVENDSTGVYADPTIS